MNKFIVATLLLFFSYNLIAQKKKKEEAQLLTDRAEWFEGSILLTDGSELKGLIKYNSRNGVLSYQDGADSKVFTALRVSAFEFFDESMQKQRIFYTLKYEDSETNVERPLFFEVLKEYKTFAVLSKEDRIDVDQKANYNSLNSYNAVTGAPSQNVRLVISQSETIYIMKSTGEIKPYFKIVNEEDGQKSLIYAGKDTKTKNKMIDRDLLEEFVTPSAYEKLIQYAKEHNLSFKKKDEFLRILGFYDQLVGK